MQITPHDNMSSDGNLTPLPMDNSAIGQHFLGKDTTGVTFSTLKFMDRVEDWVLQRLALDGVEQQEAVASNLRALGEIVARYRDRLPADNYTFLQIAGWLNTSVVVYLLDYLSQYQQDFLNTLIEFCSSVEDQNIDAALMMKRMRTLWRTRLLDRIFSPENTEYVMRILARSAL